MVPCVSPGEIPEHRAAKSKPWALSGGDQCQKQFLAFWHPSEYMPLIEEAQV